MPDVRKVLGPNISKNRRLLCGAFREYRRREQLERIRYWTPCAPPWNDQLGAYLCAAKYQFVGGGNRSGKTELGVAKAIAMATGTHPTLSVRFPPPTYGRYCSTTWEDGAKRVIIPKFYEMTPRRYLLGFNWETAWNAQSRTLTFNLDGDPKLRGSTISFFTYTQPIDAYKGDDLDWAMMDEHAPQKYFTENLARLVDRNGLLALTMTPEAGMTWEKKEIVEPGLAGDPEKRIWFFDSRLNPHLSKEGLQALIDQIGVDSPLFKAKIEGRFVALEGLVYPMFSENVHLIDPFKIPLDWHKQIVMDAHLKTAAAIGWYAWSKRGNVYKYREAEWRPTSGGAPELANFIRVKSAGDVKINDWILDEALGGKEGDKDNPSFNVFGQKNLIDQLNDAGLPFVGTNVASDKSVMPGIMKVRQFLTPNPLTGLPRFFIFRTCPKTAAQYLIYQWLSDSQADEKVYRERIRKIEDHHLDDDRYAIMAEPAWNAPQLQVQSQVTYDNESGQPQIQVYERMVQPQASDGMENFFKEMLD